MNDSLEETLLSNVFYRITLRVFHFERREDYVKTSFPCCFSVEYTWSVCRGLLEITSPQMFFVKLLALTLPTNYFITFINNLFSSWHYIPSVFIFLSFNLILCNSLLTFGMSISNYFVKYLIVQTLEDFVKTSKYL